MVLPALSALLAAALLVPPPSGDACRPLTAQARQLGHLVQTQHGKNAQPPAALLTRLAQAAAAARNCRRLADSTQHALFLLEIQARQQLGQPLRLIRLADEHLRTFGSTMPAPWRAPVLIAQARAFSSLQHYAQALARYQDALPLASALPWAEQVDLLRHMAVASLSLHDYEAAQSYYAQAAHLLQGQPASEVLRLEMELLAHRIAFHQLSEGPAADSSYRRLLPQAVTLAERFNALGQAEEAARVFVHAASLARRLGLREEAERYLARAASFPSAPLPYARLARLHEQGTLAVETGRFAAATRWLSEGLALAQRNGRLLDQYRFTLGLALLAERQGDWVRAEATYRQANRVGEAYLDELGSFDWAGLLYHQFEAAQRGLVRSLLAQRRTQEAFEALERRRALLLRRLQVQAHLAQRAGGRLQAQVDSLTLALIGVRNERLSTSPADAVMLLHRESLIQAELNALYGAVTDRQELTFLEVQHRLLARKQHLVSFFIDEGPQAQSFAFVVSADQFHAVPLMASRQHIATMLQAAAPLLGRPSEAVRVADLQFDLHALAALYDTLFRPLEPFLPPGVPVVVVPDDALFSTPFSALVRTHAGRFDYDQADYLIHHHAVSMELSAFMVQPYQPLTLPTGVLGAGRTHFTDAAPQPLPDLPLVRSELKLLARTFDRTTILLDEEASEMAFTRLAPSAGLIHLASHVLVDVRRPLYTALLLYDDPSTDYDGVLYAHELRRYYLSSAFVVLSGCNTARGASSPGEGQASLQYAFRASGAPATLSTLWLAEEEATLSFMMNRPGIAGDSRL